jgi:hypothetical protein
MEASSFQASTLSRTRCTRDDADAYTAAESHLHRRHDLANAWRLDIEDDNEILVRARGIGEDRAQATAYRQTPACLRKRVEKKPRQYIEPTTLMIYRVTSRDAAGADDLEAHIAAEWEVRAEACV